MRREPLIDIPPWALPVIVLAVTTPIAVAMLTLGPLFGLPVGGVVGAAVALTAIRLSTQRPRRRGRRRRDPEYATLPGGDSIDEAAEASPERARELAD